MDTTTRWSTMLLFSLGLAAPAHGSVVCVRTGERRGALRTRDVCRPHEQELGSFEALQLLPRAVEHVDAGATLRIGGVNVQGVSGSRATDGPVNGRGNLIVGGNASDLAAHAFVVGDEHTYTSYGGFVAGAVNTISGIHASVWGGGMNTASGPRGTGAGGLANEANGRFANEASGLNASARGGKTTRHAGTPCRSMAAATTSRAPRVRQCAAERATGPRARGPRPPAASCTRRRERARRAPAGPRTLPPAPMRR